jgi:hypothetical protein
MLNEKKGEERREGKELLMGKARKGMFFCIKNEPSKMGQYGRYCRIVFTYST